MSITVCILTLGVLFGMVPDRTEEALKARKTISETLAIQVAALAATNQLPLLEHTLREMVGRNDEILTKASHLSRPSSGCETPRHTSPVHSIPHHAVSRWNKTHPQ